MHNSEVILKQARGLAGQLVSRKVDINEVERVLVYARRQRDLEKTIAMIQRLATQDILIYSNRTKIYAKTMLQVLTPALKRAVDVDFGLLLLGWIVRFMRYEGAQRNRGEN